jgi:hypothetical protein
LREGEADSEERGEHENRRGAGHEREPDGDDGLREGDDEEHVSRVVAVGEEAGRTREEHGGRPYRHEQERHHDPGCGRLLELQRQRNERQPVPERRETDRAHEDVQVSAQACVSSQTTRPSRVTIRPIAVPG